MNPEFSRLFSSEMTPARVVVIPVILCLLATLSSTSGMMISISTSGFVLLSFWGMISVSRLLVQEIRSGTWDSIRMSNMTPWSIAWPRVLGGASPAWYGRLLLLALGIVSAISSNQVSVGFIFTFALTAVAAALVVEMLSVTFALNAAPRLRRSRDGRGFFNPGIFAIILIPMFNTFLSSFYLGKVTVPIDFWGIFISPLNVILMTAAIVTACAAWGLYRAARSELQIPVSPYFAPALVLFFSWYLIPIIRILFSRELVEIDGLRLFPSVLGFLSIASGYLLILTADKSGPELLKFLARRKAGIETELPFMALLVTLSFVAIAFFLEFGLEAAGNYQIMSGAALLSFALFAVRDISIFLYVSIKNPNSGRSDLFVLLLLAILYGLLPGVLSVLRQNEATVLFWPQVKPSIGATLAGLPGCFLAVVALASKIKELMRSAPA